ncbi:MAG: tetraacyldisaccharide 4'-kinase, partial [Pseudomonadota bacterium]
MGAATPLQQAWTRRGPLALALWPLSQLYRVLITLRRRLYQLGVFSSIRMPVPVVVVGNVVAGGSGKTPLVLALVRHLQQRGLQPVVVSRGHGRSDATCREVLEYSSAAETGDEPLLLRRATGAPVFVAPRRADAARAALARYPQTRVIVCDDGLQHLALQRDVEICVFGDASIGNGWLLPAGPLREPWPRHADLVV